MSQNQLWPQVFTDKHFQYDMDDPDIEQWVGMDIYKAYDLKNYGHKLPRYYKLGNKKIQTALLICCDRFLSWLRSKKQTA